MIGSLALSLGLVSAGGGALAASPVASIEGVRTVAASAPGKEGPATINNLTERSVVPLVVHAKKLYTYASRGGNVFSPELFTYKSTGVPLSVQ
ncbi:hypothetical protein ACFTAO_43225 [Paenibacillus rhizoplanae]